MDGICLLLQVGDVLEPENNIATIGSGGNYTLAAARALMATDKTAEEIAKEAIQIASEIYLCLYKRQ